MTAFQLRRLFFGVSGDRLAAPQTVHARMRRLVDLRYVDIQVLDGGRGSGPYAYGLTARGLRVLGAPVRRRGHPGPIRHDVLVAELRVNLELGLRAAGGELREWVGEPDLRSLLHGVTAPRPDGLAHWRLGRREGVIAFEVDTGTEPFATLVAKLPRYAKWFRSGNHRELVPGLQLRPRLAFVAPRARASRLVRHLAVLASPPLVFVGIDEEVIPEPLAPRWWRSDEQRLSVLL